MGQVRRLRVRVTVTRALVVVAGMVVSRILKANIPVQNGIVHLIDKPLMVVARSLYDYLMEEGRDPANRLHEFAMLVMFYHDAQCACVATSEFLV